MLSKYDKTSLLTKRQVNAHKLAAFLAGYLKHKYFSSEDSITFQLQKEVLSVLKENFGPAQLVVGFAKHALANFGSRCSAIVLECWAMIQSTSHVILM